jgi:glycosyltransferase involved in cell wall biosynthesis
VTPDSPRVSIAVPVYNGERFVAQSLDSLLAQTYTDFELVIVDNCSTDGTEDICRSFASRDPRVRYFRNERNIGGPGNFCRAFRLSRGEYHKWSTADDYWEPTVVEKGVALLDANPELVLAYPRTRLVTGDGTLIREFDDHLHLMEDSPAKRMRRVLDTSTLCHAHLGVLRRSAMLRTSLMGSELASDIRFLAELSLYGKFAVIPEYLFYRRFHEDCSSWERDNMDRQRAYYDPGRNTVFGMHTLRRYAHLTAAAFHAPLGARERTRVIKSLGRRLMWQGKAFWREVKGMGHAR